MKTIAALALVATAAQVSAGTIYKYIAPDGAVTYSSEPIAGASPAKKLDLDPATNVVSPPRASNEKDDSERLKQLQASRDAREQDRAAVARAQRVLAEAEAALMAGREPLPGERRGTCVPRTNAAGGTGIACMTQAGIGDAPGNGGTPQFNGVILSTPDENYDRRIARLEAEVEEAELLLQEAILREKGY